MVGALPYGDERDAQKKACHQTHHGVGQNSWFIGNCRDFGRIHQTHVTGTHRFGDAGLFHFLKQRLIERSIGFRVTLQNIVPDGFLGLFRDYSHLRFVAQAKQALAAPGGFEFVPDALRPLRRLVSNPVL